VPLEGDGEDAVPYMAVENGAGDIAVDMGAGDIAVDMGAGDIAVDMGDGTMGAGVLGAEGDVTIVDIHVDKLLKYG